MRAICMATKILIPTPLRPYTDKRDAVEAEGTTIGELLADLTRRHSGLKAHLYNEQGKLRSFVNVYLNDEDIRYLQKEQTPVSAGDTISIIPSVAGGQSDHEFVHLVICSSGHFEARGCRCFTNDQITK